jgi:transcriptional regulator with XRE-family HTH domain
MAQRSLFADILRRELKRKPLIAQQVLAVEAGVSSILVSKVLNSKAPHIPKLDIAWKLADAIGHIRGEENLPGAIMNAYLNAGKP